MDLWSRLSRAKLCNWAAVKDLGFTIRLTDPEPLPGGRFIVSAPSSRFYATNRQTTSFTRFVELLKLLSFVVVKEVSLDQLSAARFTELVRTKFRVLVEPGREIQLELSAVTITPGNRRATAAEQTYESFSLLFSGPADVPLEQRMYRFAHERLGWFDLFIVPVSAERTARQYEAVFNRRSS